MTGTDTKADNEGRQELAGEIALGLISDADARAARARDPLLYGEVLRWRHELGALGLEATALPPSPAAWAGISKAIAAPDEGVGPSRAGWLRTLNASLDFWRGIGAVGLSAAAIAVAFAVLRTPGLPPAPEQPIVASRPAETVTTDRILLVSSLLPRDGPPAYVATYDGERRRLVLVPAATNPSPDGVPYLWLVPNDSGEPVGIGRLDPESPVVLDLNPDAARSANEAAGLVITIEPAGGDMGAAPRGAVIAHGKFSKF